MIGEAVGVREARPPDLGGSRSGIGTAAMPPAVTVAERRQVRPVASRAVRSALQQAAGTEGPGRRDKGRLQSHSGRHRGEVASAAEWRRLGGSWWLADALAEGPRLRGVRPSVRSEKSSGGGAMPPPGASPDARSDATGGRTAGGRQMPKSRCQAPGSTRR